MCGCILQGPPMPHRRAILSILGTLAPEAAAGRCSFTHLVAMRCLACFGPNSALHSAGSGTRRYSPVRGDPLEVLRNLYFFE